MRQVIATPSSSRAHSVDLQLTNSLWWFPPSIFDWLNIKHFKMVWSEKYPHNHTCSNQKQEFWWGDELRYKLAVPRDLSWHRTHARNWTVDNLPRCLLALLRSNTHVTNPPPTPHTSEQHDAIARQDFKVDRGTHSSHARKTDTQA